ncbi:SdpI family protein [Paraclostridium bifermentans]|uniref:SdpI family protein n=1 Tax=Paraclostridium bifermentans TaxID=1490 RepID=UPI00041076C7|nr:SdpI family protein [Paraclostridium bifermentans]MCR1875003.1 SdpI family protein [Paraclostridium bifermentans]
MKKIDITGIVLSIASLLIIIWGTIAPKNNLSFAVVVALAIISMIILDIKASKVSNLSEGNPKIKTMRFLNRLSMVVFIGFYLLTIMPSTKNLLNLENNDMVIVTLASILIMVFGNSAPKIPFNRYLGLRLPWTIRDEDTWKLAHKILGYISFPIAIIMFISAFFFKIETSSTICILLWIIIPGSYSFIFYYKKMKGLKV